MNKNVGLTALDIAKFYYDRDIAISRIAEISNDIWNKRNKYLWNYRTKTKKQFFNEINSMLNKLLFKNKLEVQSIIQTQKELNLEIPDYNLYNLNEDKIKLFLKQIKLRLDYEKDTNYILIKFKTLILKSGYKRKSTKLLKSLIKYLELFNLYISLNHKEICKINDLKNIDLNCYIKIYTYDIFLYNKPKKYSKRSLKYVKR